MSIARSVLARRSEGVLVPFRQVGFRATPPDQAWYPKANAYHKNVAAWVSSNPHDKHIRGYLIFDLRRPYGAWKIHAYSVVDMDGQLFDITPSAVSQPYPFVRHVGTEEEFAAMTRARAVVVPA
jgi:hypothetical protein